MTNDQMLAQINAMAGQVTAISAQVAANAQTSPAVDNAVNQLSADINALATQVGVVPATPVTPTT